MKDYGCTLAIVIILLFNSLLVIAISPPVSANPIPTSQESGTPMVDSETPIIFREESILYTIDNEHEAKVRAEYIFYNPANRSFNLTVYLPFSSVPKDLFIVDYNLIIFYQETRRSRDSQYPIFNITDESDGNRPFTFAFFNLSFHSYETKTLVVTYSQWYAVRFEDYFTDPVDESYCLYIAKSGRYWNGTIEGAKFAFRINKDLYSYGLDGFEKHDEGKYILGVKKFSNWEPDQNIEARWYYINPERVAVQTALYIVPIVIGIVIAIVIVIRRVRKRRNHG